MSDPRTTMQREWFKARGLVVDRLMGQGEGGGILGSNLKPLATLWQHPRWYRYTSDPAQFVDWQDKVEQLRNRAAALWGGDQELPRGVWLPLLVVNPRRIVVEQHAARASWRIEDMETAQRTLIRVRRRDDPICLADVFAELGITAGTLHQHTGVRYRLRIIHEDNIERRHRCQALLYRTDMTLPVVPFIAGNRAVRRIDALSGPLWTIDAWALYPLTPNRRRTA